MLSNGKRIIEISPMRAPRAGRGLNMVRWHQNKQIQRIAVRLRIFLIGLFITISFATDAGCAWAGEARNSVVADKAKALSRLLNSKTARLIDLSESEQGRAMLNEARVLYDWAQTELMRGDVKNAELNMTKALRFVSRATVVVSWQGRVTNPNQRKYFELMESIAVYRKSLVEAVAANKSGRGQFLDEARFVKAMDVAHRLGKGRKYYEALPHLEDAYSLIERAVVAFNDNATLVYTKWFRTAKEEFMYESGRYAGYQSLVTQLKTRRPERSGMGMKMIAESETYHMRAIEVAGGGDVDNAVGLMEEANRWMGRAAKILGAL